MRKLLMGLIILFLFTIISAQSNFAQSKIGKTRIVMLGTGNPNPDPEHSGCSIAIIVNEKSYIIDFGPGLVRNASALTPRYGGNINALKMENLKLGFLTHLHSDHTVGLPDFILTPWVLGRKEPLQIYGPEGTKKMIKYILKAYEDDIKYRLYGLEPANNKGWRVIAHEYSEGEIYKDEYVKVEAFFVPHGSWPNSYGFRFTTPDKVIVISGDTMPCENIIKYAKDADVLIHEVYYKKSYDKKNKFWKKYHAKNHTSTLELAKIAKEAKPKLLVLYHTLYWGADDKDLLDEIATIYSGKVIVGHDRQIIE